jgi:HEAT repeat protein
MRAMAIVCLSRINPEGKDAVIDLLQHETPFVRTHAAFVLSRDKFPDAIDPLLDALKDKAVQDGIASSSGLDWIVDQRGIEMALRAFTMQDVTDDFRRVALGQIIRHGHPRRVEFLLQMLSNADYPTRRTTIAAVMRLRVKEAVVPLIEIVKTAKYNLDRAEAAEALGELGDRRAFDALVGALSDPTSLVRSDAAEALGKLGDPRAVTHLLPLLDDNRYDARISAAGALAKFDDPRIAPALIKAAKHPNVDTRSAAVRALANVRGPGVLERLVEALDDESSWVRHYAAYALGKCGDPRAVVHLARLLEDKRVDRRCNAAYAIAQIDDPRVAPALIKATDHPDKRTRHHAIHALAKVKGPGVLDTLIEALEDEYLREVACESLARHNETQIPELIRANLAGQNAEQAIKRVHELRNHFKQEELRQPRRPGMP